MDFDFLATGDEGKVARDLASRARTGFLRTSADRYAEPDPAVLMKLGNRIQVQTSPDGRIKMYLDKKTNKLMSREEFNSFLNFWKTSTQNKVAVAGSKALSADDFPLDPAEIANIENLSQQTAEMVMGGGPGRALKAGAQMLTEAKPAAQAAAKLAEKVPTFGVATTSLSLPQRTAFSLFRERPEAFKRIIGAIKGGQPEAVLQKIAADNQIFASELNYLKEAVAKDLLPKVAGAEVAAVKAAPAVTQAANLPGLPTALEEGAAAAKGLASKIPYGTQAADAAAFRLNQLRQAATQARGAIAEGLQSVKQSVANQFTSQVPQKAGVIAKGIYNAGASFSPQVEEWMRNRMQQEAQAGQSGQNMSLPQGGMSKFDSSEFGMPPVPEGTAAPQMPAAENPTAAPQIPLAAKKGNIKGRLPVKGGAVAAGAGTGAKAAGAAGAAAPATAAMPTPTATPNIPMDASGRPNYNYYSEMLNSADANNAYYRDFVNLREQARMAAIEAGNRGESYRFVPIRDVKSNRVYFVNANGNDIALDMNDKQDRERFNKIVEQSGVDPIKMSEWMSRSSRPLMRHMMPGGGYQEAAPDFNFNRQRAQESVDTQGNKLQFGTPTVNAGVAQMPVASKPATPQTTTMPEPTAQPPMAGTKQFDWSQFGLENPTPAAQQPAATGSMFDWAKQQAPAGSVVKETSMKYRSRMPGRSR